MKSVLAILLLFVLCASCQKEDSDIVYYEGYELFVQNLNSEAKVFITYQTNDFKNTDTLPPTGLRIKFDRKRSGDYVVLAMASNDFMYVDVQLLNGKRIELRRIWFGETQETLTYFWK